MATTSEVRSEYERREAAAREEEKRLAAGEGRLATMRLSLFAIASVIAWLALARDLFSINWILLPALGFVLLVVAHERSRRRRQAVLAVADFYARGIARLDGKWSDYGSTGDAFAPESHPYADDLDLFGRGSLFQLISLAQTSVGERTLASWLLQPAVREVCAARQEAVEELRDELDLRERLATLGQKARAATKSHALADWAEAPRVAFAAWERAAAPILAVAGVASLVAWIAGQGSLPFLIVVILEAFYSMRIRPRVAEVIRTVDEHQREVSLLRDVTTILGERAFSSPLLARLWNGDGTRPKASAELQRLVRLIDLADAVRNQFFLPFAALLIWTPQVTFALSRWRERNRDEVRRWMDAVGTFEAISSLAGYAFEHPDDVKAEIVDSRDALFEAEGIAHPLIPEMTAVRNDVAFSSRNQMLIVSGSNMSGKSTLLRSVGVNAVLAQAGCVVRAKRLRMSPMNVGASIRISDSLQEGSSKFYAELMRIRTIVEMASIGVPLLFLLDEIFNGTNSHDRRIGAEAVLRRLVAAGAIGMVTTHDLALAKLADSLETARNVHFEDHLEEGRVAFDYRLKEGVVTRSNALELMRAVGLEV